jgi:hypothetical protein
MRYSPAVLDWLLEQPDWRSSPNPLRSLDGSWQQQIATAVEKLMLDGQLREGATLSVNVSETSTDRRILFDIVGPTGQSLSQ